MVDEMKVKPEEKDGKIFYPMVHADMERGAINDVPSFNHALSDLQTKLKEKYAKPKM